MKNIYKIYTAIVLFTILSILPINKASAASVYLESSRSSVAVGDTVIVTLKINAEGAVINTVDGGVAVKSGGNSVAVQEFSLANSAFGLWPRTPSLSKDSQIISFVGGVPGGFSIEGASLFKIIFQAKKEGIVKIEPQNMIAFANDGKGTKLPVSTKGITINVTPKKEGTTPNDEWGSIIAKDIKPPEDFIIVPGQDKTMFEGKKFVYFSALDNQTGVAYYEVSEDGASPIRSGSTYVLQNQNDGVKLSVVAFDKAGNKKVAKYPPSSKPIGWASIIIVVLIGFVLKIVYTKRKSKKNVTSL